MSTDLADPGLRPAAPAAATPAPEAPGLHFSASSPWGALHLHLQADAPVPHAAAAALRLANLEPLLAALEAWLCLARPADETAPQAWHGPDWRWPAADGADMADTAHVTGVAEAAEAPVPPVRARAQLHWPPDPERTGPAGAAAQLQLPWALLRRLPAPTPELRGCLQWQPEPALCVLATPRLSAEEALQLEPGGLLLLPASFQPGWSGRVRAAAEPPGTGWPVLLARPDAPLPAPGPAEAAAPPAPGGRWELRRACALPLAAPVLCGWGGWGGEGRVEPLPLADEATLWLLGSPHEPGLCVARGRLVPWGQGQALLVAACALPGPAAAAPTEPARGTHAS
jgi:hypothetical protein